MTEQLESNVLNEVFTSIIEDADANILFVNQHFEVISLNPGFYWIFLEHYSLDLKPGTSIINAMMVVNPTLATEWRKRCERAMKGNSFKVEDIFDVDHRKHYWEIYFKPVFYKGQIFVSVFSRDITIRKAYQERIIRNEANLRSIINTVDSSIWLINTRFELIDFNKEFFKQYKKAFGIRLERGKNILELLPEDMEQLKLAWKERYESGLKGRFGKYMDTYSIDQEPRTFEIKTYPIVEDGIVTGLTVYSRDITQQKKAENLLLTQNEELSRINSELDRFVYSASHDLRAPLMSVNGLVNMIKVDNDPNNTEKYLKLIEQSVYKLDNFITDIIHYSRNARMEVLAKEIDFDAILQESIDSLKFMEGANQVRSIREIRATVPFYSDHSRLMIVFNNILSNAVRYRDPWKEDSFIHIQIESGYTQAKIKFTDNGIGIGEEYLDKVFKMFFRASADSKGSGLGLYIVRGAVEKLGGTISVTSQLGSGTTFEIILPNKSGNAALN
ncbi:MAG TPA: PAS domain-containing sensor histidine kinase [Cyclobacteriaceae bacterium]|nr:PAS domain-containing sensor histidine kinase [Cyclobacteriaceae bacterium]HRJ82063.1 PAS domain-containing sensor histidine kinase [Cyclobacteriaceae bacterium]